MSSLYERLGGRPAIEQAVEIFYVRMLADDRVRRFFDDIDMPLQKKKQASFLTMVTGGPVRYTGKGMRHAHEHLLERGLDDEHVDVVIEHLGATLRELGAREEDVAEVAALANSVRDDVLGRTKVA